MGNYKKYETSTGTRWHVQGYIGVDELTGKQVNFNRRGFKTKREAQSAYRKALRDFEEDISMLEKSNKTYQQVYEEWLPTYKMSVKESTFNKTTDYFRLHILPKFGDILIKKITTQYFQRVVNEWAHQFVTFRKLVSYTSRVFTYALNVGYISDNPRERIIIPRVVNNTRHKDTSQYAYYTREELTRLLQLIYQDEGLKWYVYFRLLAYTGMRRGEALALTWSDVNNKDNLLNIDKTLSLGMGNKQNLQTTKTESGERIITIDKETMNYLEKWRIEQAKFLLSLGYNTLKKKQPIFNGATSNEYLSISQPRNILHRVCQRHDFRFINIHGFRHTHCSLLFDAGVPIKDVSERLGHSDIQTTMNIYTHVTEESRDRSAEKFARYMQG